MTSFARSALGVLAAVTLIAASGDAHAAKKKAKDATPLEIPAEFRNAPALVLEDRRGWEVTPAKSADYTVHRRVLIQDPRGFAHADQTIYYDRSSSKIAGFVARTVSAEGKVTEVTEDLKRDTVVYSRGESEWRQLQFTFPAVEVGSTLEWTYVIHEGEPERIRTWQAQEEIPVLESSFAFKLKQPVYILPLFPHMVARNPYAEHCEIVDQKTGSRGSRLELACRAIPALTSEPLAPPADDLRIEFTLGWGHKEFVTETWDYMARAIGERIERFLSETAAVTDLAVELASGSSTTNDRVDRINDYVKSKLVVRSVYSPTGPILDIRNTTADAVLAAGGGLEDEITLVTLALLRGAGVRAFPLAVRDRTMGSFNFRSFDGVDHLVLQVVLDESSVVLDPSCRYCRTGSIEWRYWGRPAGVAMRDGGVTVIQLASVPAQYNSETREEHVDLWRDGSARVSGTVTWGGQLEIDLRRRWAPLSESARRDDLLDSAAIEAGDPKIEITDPQQLSTQLRAKYDFKRDDLFRNGGRLFVRPTDVFSSRLPIPTVESRSQPVRLPYGLMVQFRQIFTIPETHVVRELPSAPALSGPGLMFQQEWIRGPGSDEVTWTGRLKTEQTEFSPEEYPEARSFAVRLRRVLRDGIVVEPRGAGD